MAASFNAGRNCTELAISVLITEPWSVHVASMHSYVLSTLEFCVGMTCTGNMRAAVTPVRAFTDENVAGDKHPDEKFSHEDKSEGRINTRIDLDNPKVADNVSVSAGETCTYMLHASLCHIRQDDRWKHCVHVDPRSMIHVLSRNLPC